MNDDSGPLEIGQIFFRTIDEFEKTNLEDLFRTAGEHLKIRNLCYSKIRSIYGPHKYVIGIKSTILDVQGPHREWSVSLK